MAAKEKSARDALEGMSKDELVTRAEALGIEGARKFTKVELVDEIVRSTGGADRGLLGRARDLLREVVERGLARAAQVPAARLEDAPPVDASRADSPSIESPSVDSPPVNVDEREVPPVESVSAPRAEPIAVVPTVTLAEIFFAQGHVARARSILEQVLRASPHDEAAHALAVRIEARSRRVASRATPEPEPARAPASESAPEPASESAPEPARAPAPEPARAPAPEPASAAPAPEPAPAAPAPEPLTPPKLATLEIEPEAFLEPAREITESFAPVVPAMLDDAPFPGRYDVDECVALAVDETTVYVYWEARRATTERARRVMRKGQGEPVSTLRVLVVEPHPSGPRVETRDFEIVDLEYGEYFVRDLPADAVVRAAIGLRQRDRFLPIAHTLEVEVPASGPSGALAHEIVIWSESGTRPESPGAPVAAVRPLDRDAGALGLPPLPAPPGEPRDERGLSSLELARRARIARSSALHPGAAARFERPGASERFARPPSSASWLDGR